MFLAPSRIKSGIVFARGAACAAATLILFSASAARAQDGVAGKWEIAQDFNGQTNYSEMKIDKDGGGLKGTWNDAALADVKFEGDKLTFVRTIKFGDNENKMNYTGTLKDGVLAGTMGSDFGEFKTTARRALPLSPAVGAWKIADGQTFKISQAADGKLAGRIVADKGAGSVSALKFDGGKLSFKLASKAEGAATTATSAFEGTIKDGKLEGTLDDKKVAADPLGAKLAGTWDLTGEFGFGGNTRKLVIFPDLTARYQLFDGLTSVGDVKLDGDQATWQTKMSFGDNSISFGFKGKLEGDTLNGQITTDQGANDFKGKRAAKS